MLILSYSTLLLHCTTLHCTTLHYTTLHYTAVHCTALHLFHLSGTTENGTLHEKKKKSNLRYFKFQRFVERFSIRFLSSFGVNEKVYDGGAGEDEDVVVVILMARGTKSK